ncbi:MAG: sensor histidine kinase [Deltaproteobacteria bacterium]|nr:sensor histidine kinase [Deltaproteobacteria bacterium]
MAWALPTPGVAPLVVGENFQSERAAGYIEIFDSPPDQYSLEQVRQLPAERFHPNGPLDPNYGFSDVDHWMRMTIRALPNGPDHLLLEWEDPTTDFYEVFVVENGKTVRRWSGGDSYPFDVRPILNRTPLYAIPLKPGAVLEVYIQLRPGFSIAPLAFYSPNAFFKHTAEEHLLIGIFFGGFALIFLYNLFLWVSLRDNLYLFYLANLAAWALFSAIQTGLAFQYVFPNAEKWVNVPMVFALGLLIFFVAQFSRKFLETQRYLPAWDRVLLFIQLSVFIPWVTGIFLHPSHPFLFYVVVALASNSVQLIVGVLSWRRGVPSAGYYLAAWFMLLVAGIVFTLRSVGVLPNNLLTQNGMQLGVLLEMATLSFALADRFNRMRREKEEALLQALEHEKTSVLRLRENEELQAAKNQAEAAREKAESATALKDKFVSLVAHDIRSPFSSILVMAQTMEEKADPPLPPEQKEMASAIQSRGRQMLRMIEDLLNMNRIQTGKIVPKVERVELWPLVEEVFLLKALAQEKGVAMVNNIPQDFHVWADRQLTFEVLQNLVSNAIKFCSAGQTITVEAPKGEKKRLAVTDNGKGVDPLLLPNLFDPTVKTTAPGTAGERGTGMGLPLCHEIMAAMGGKISVESQRGKGSTFTLEFPKE